MADSWVKLRALQDQPWGPGPLVFILLPSPCGSPGFSRDKGHWQLLNRLLPAPRDSRKTDSGHRLPVISLTLLARPINNAKLQYSQIQHP